MLFNDVAYIAKQHARFDDCNRKVQALPRCFHDTNRVWVRLCLVANVVRFVEIAVVAAIVDADVDVEDIAIKEDALVGYAVANDLVGRGADGFREVIVV
jgi:hypothetical protein